MIGSLLMLVAILVLVWLNYQHTARTFDILQLTAVPMTRAVQSLLFLAFGLAFAIKVPMFPFHTWLPDAHVEAPTAGSVILAGVLLKMGAYGFLRFCLPLFPEASAAFAPLLIALAIIGIIYGALVALVQPDMKKLVAYSSVSHVGVAVLGIFVFTIQGMMGGMVQMISHGLSTGAQFLCVGMIYERRHTREIAEFGGIWRLCRNMVPADHGDLASITTVLVRIRGRVWCSRSVTAPGMPCRRHGGHTRLLCSDDSARASGRDYERTEPESERSELREMAVLVPLVAARSDGVLLSPCRPD